jgi:hypothetical protein
VRRDSRLTCVGALQGVLGMSRARSVTQIDATYGHLVPDSEEYLRGLTTGTTRKFRRRRLRARKSFENET